MKSLKNMFDEFRRIGNAKKNLDINFNYTLIWGDLWALSCCTGGKPDKCLYLNKVLGDCSWHLVNKLCQNMITLKWLAFSMQHICVYGPGQGREGNVRFRKNCFSTLVMKVGTQVFSQCNHLLRILIFFLRLYLFCFVECLGMPWEL